MHTPTVRNPAAEATALLPEGMIGRVLEPSPPAVDTGPWFADDPAARGSAPGATIVTATSTGDRRWAELAATDPTIAAYAVDHWLVPADRLPPVPDGYVAARDDYHRLAYAVVAEARRRANGRFGLRWVRGGFGTPYFGADVQVRVEGPLLVVQHGDRVRAAPISTLSAAGELVGVVPATDAAEHDSPPLGDLDRPLRADPATGAFLDAWYGFATAALEELRVSPGVIDPGRVQLWPGHFDPAIEIGDADAGGRATYGASPGDGSSAEPYLYVGPWGDIDQDDPYWNAAGFPGALLPHAELLAGTDPFARALAFYRDGLARLTRR